MFKVLLYQNTFTVYVFLSYKKNINDVYCKVLLYQQTFTMFMSISY